MTRSMQLRWKCCALVPFTLALGSFPSLASSPDPQTEADRASADACNKASGLINASSGPVTRFSNRTRVDARIVIGQTSDATAGEDEQTMLCLYNRRSKRVEAVEMAPASLMPTSDSIRETTWLVTNVAGAELYDQTRITFRLGTDGFITGTSGCNEYSARYSLDGSRIRVFPPFIGTGKVCPPTRMEQEQRFREFMERAGSWERGANGGFVIVTHGLDRISFQPERRRP